MQTTTPPAPGTSAGPIANSGQLRLFVIALFLIFGGITSLNDVIIPKLKEHGGYICGSDHSVPDSVSLEEFGRFVAKAKSLIAY